MLVMYLYIRLKSHIDNQFKYFLGLYYISLVEYVLFEVKLTLFNARAIEAITCFCERQRWLASYGQ